jgi:hypothetical protein
MEDDLKKMKNDHTQKWNGRPQNKIKKMEDYLKKST